MAQTMEKKVYYRDTTGKIYSQTEILDQIQGNKYSYTVTSEYTSGDSMIRNFVLRSKATEERSEKTQTEFLRRYTTKPLLNKPFPQFSLVTLNGASITQDSLKGKIVHVNIWSVTCGPCIREFPELNLLKEKYNDKDRLFLAILPEDQAAAEKILNRIPLNYIVIPNAADLIKSLDVDDFPTNFFINKQGVIVERDMGLSYQMDPATKKYKVDVVDKFSEILDKIIAKDR